jgi:hypothetical protein
MTITPERLAELIEATDMRGRYEPAEYCKRIDADTATALRDYQRLRGMTSAEAGEIVRALTIELEQRDGEYAQVAPQLLAKAIALLQGSECKPQSGERKAVVDGLREVRKYISQGHYEYHGRGDSILASVDRAIALLSQEGLSDEQREACKAGAQSFSNWAGHLPENHPWFRYAAVLRQLANEGKP